MNSISKILGLLAAALIVAIASFQDRIAVTLGTAALVAMAAALVVLVLGAGLALVRKNGLPKKDVSSAIAGEGDIVEVDEPHSSLT